MNFQDWIPFVGMAGMVLLFWRQGGNTASTQVITTYREQVDQLTKQVAELTSKVGELTGALKEKDERIKTLEAIATNRNPEMETFIKSMNEAMERGEVLNKAAQEYMKNTTEYLHNIKNALTVRALDDQINIKKERIRNLNKKV